MEHNILWSKKYVISMNPAFMTETVVNEQYVSVYFFETRPQEVLGQQEKVQNCHSNSRKQLLTSFFLS